jgi:plastocyanin
MNTKAAAAATGVLLLALAVFAGCGSKTTTTPATTPKTQGTSPSTAPPATSVSTVKIKDLAFVPSTLRVKAGDTVIWTNDDTVAHTITGTGFDSGTVQPGGTFQHKFPAEGTFDYHCTIHPSMTGQVIVEAATGGSPGTTTPTAPTTPTTPGY